MDIVEFIVLNKETDGVITLNSSAICIDFYACNAKLDCRVVGVDSNITSIYSAADDISLIFSPTVEIETILARDIGRPTTLYPAILERHSSWRTGFIAVLVSIAKAIKDTRTIKVACELESSS